MSAPLPCRFIYPIDVNAKYQRPDKNPTPAYKFALINHCPATTQEHQIAVRVVEVIWQNSKGFYGLYQIERIFESRAEAMLFASQHHIPMAWHEENSKLVEYVH